MEKQELAVTKPEDYATLPNEDEVVELVKMPSGAVFRLRRVDVQGLALMGELPLSLVNEGINTWRERGLMPKKADTDQTEQTEETDMDQTVRHLIYVRQTVVDNCLEPRIGYNEMGVVSLLDSDGKAIAKLQRKDFVYALQWITSQVGVEAGRLNNFLNRQERRAANAGADRKKLRNAPVVAAQD